MTIPSKPSVDTLILKLLQASPGEWINLSTLSGQESFDDIRTSANKLRGQGIIDSKLHTIGEAQKTLYRHK